MARRQHNAIDRLLLLSSRNGTPLSLPERSKHLVVVVAAAAVLIVVTGSAFCETYDADKDFVF